MRVAIAGAGKVGRFIAGDLLRRGHQVTLIDDDGELITRHRGDLDCRWVQGDACEPLNLAGAALDTCDVMVAATGDDKVNLVASLLAKQEFGIPRVLARVNHPKNAWLFNETWGVDIPVSATHLLTSLIEEAVTVGDLITLLRLEQGKVFLVECKLGENSPVAGKVLGEVTLPRDSSIVAVVRRGHVIPPREDTPLMIGDEVMALTIPDVQLDLEQLLTGTRGLAEPAD